MRIRHSRPESDYTVIPNGALRDERLSYRARGVLAELLTRPDEWDSNADAMAAHSTRRRPWAKEGRRPVRAAYAELEAAGYITRRKVRGKRGQWVTETDVTDDTTGGMSAPPAQTDKSPGRTDVPLTDVPPGWPIQQSNEDARARPRRAPSKRQAPQRAEWCGLCSDPRLRQRYDAEDRPRRCEVCHPLRDQPVNQETR